jgi:hypothetical protein
MDEGRGADRQTSREVELLRKRVKTLMKEKSQVLEPWEHTHDWGHKGQPDTTLLYCQAEPPPLFADPSGVCQALVKVELLSSLYAKNVSALQSTLQDKLHQRDTTIDALRQQLKTQQDKVRRTPTRRGTGRGGHGSIYNQRTQNIRAG